MVSRELHHVLIAIPLGGEPAGRAFFRDLVGLTEIRKPANLRARGGIWFQLGSRQLHLGVERDFRPASKAHPAIEVDDLSALRQRLSASGVETWEDEPLEDYDRFYAKDPFGNRIEFLQRAAQRV